MMKKSFEELEIWELSFTLGKELGTIFYDKQFRNYGFQDQIMRAVLSISNNIAEGNDAGSAKQFIKYLQIAKGSSAEVRNMIYFAYEFGFITDEYKTEVIKKLQNLSIKIYNLIAYLKTKI